MTSFFKGRKLWRYISTKIEKPIETAMEESEYDIGKINSQLAKYVDPTIGVQLAKFAHLKDAWDYLAHLYVQTKSAKRYLLERDIRNAQGDDSTHAFYVKITALLGVANLMTLKIKPEFDRLSPTHFIYRLDTGQKNLTRIYSGRVNLHNPSTHLYFLPFMMYHY